MRLFAIIVLALTPCVGIASERLPIPSENAIKLWQQYCLNYSRDHSSLRRSLQASSQFNETNESWFTGRGLAFDVGLPMDGTCVAAFLPSDGSETAFSWLRSFVKVLDSSFFENREGTMQFAVMQSKFTVFPAHDEDSGVVFFTLMNE